MKLFKVFFLLVISFPAYSSTANKVNSWFNNMNYSNITQPGVYEGQSARHATLGSISTRAEISQPFQLLSIQTPKASAGCAGIDMFAGGFSAINGSEIVDNLRNIGQNAAGLVFMLAIQQVSPALSGLMEKIQSFANFFNKMNMDSCQAAASLMGGAINVIEGKNGNCIMKRAMEHGDDYTKARQICAGFAGRQATEDYAQNGFTPDPNLTDMTEGNIAWYILMQDPFFRGDLEFAELIMNITGTLILDEPNADGIKMRRIPPAINGDTQKQRFKNIFNALLHGSNAQTELKIYKCTDGTTNPSSCKNMTSSLQNVTPNWVGLYGKIEGLMNSIVTKIQTDSQLTLQEKGLIIGTQLPVYRYLASASTYYQLNANITDMSNGFIQLISKDILIRSLKGVIENAEQSAADLKGGKSDAEKVVAYREELEGVLAGLSAEEKENAQMAEALISMREKIIKYERALLPKLDVDIVSSSLYK